MATKKTTKKAPAKTSASKSAAAKATKKTTPKAAVSKTTTSVIKQTKVGSKLPKNLINIVAAEVVGTFVLTLVALFSGYVMQSFYVGLTLMLIVMAIGGISGAHINPAVTFGLWSMRKLKTSLVPFYWAAQFLGAMAAVVLVGQLTSGAFFVSFDQFMTFSWLIFAIELIGTAVFMFGIAAIIERGDLKSTGKAVGIGMALTIALIVSGTITTYVQSSTMAAYQKEQSQKAKSDDKSEKSYPHEVYVDGATLNPAVALAVTERTDTQLQSGNVLPSEEEKSYSRLSLEVILATLIGAALGGNLFLLVNYRNESEE